MGLENYTLCADTLRMLVQSPIITPYGEGICQKNDSYVWSLLLELLEKRMDRGEFVLIDATHSRSSDFSRYNSLCSKYRYRKFYVDFSDVDIETCKKQNKMRPLYKQVPERVIDKMYSRLKTQNKTSGWVQIDRNKFWEEIGMKCFDFSEYEKIHVFGDIHGCYSVLKEYFENNPYKENEMYIFCGDYVDRGIENKQTLEFLMKLSENQNVLFLEGNHEHWLRKYANDEIEDIKSKTFLNKTMLEIIDIDKSELRIFCRKIGQIAYFTFGNKKYIITHGGLSYVPKELQLVSTNQFIHGVGNYNVDIDDVFNNNYVDTIQIHGHRNTYEIDNVENHSYNLEGKIEFGGHLKVLQLSKNDSPKLVKIKNNVYGNPNDVNEFRECRAIKVPNVSLVDELRNSRYVKETVLNDHISSFNFTRNAFYNKKWNDITTKARGLFIDVNKNEVVARGYNKFFNVGEKRETEITTLATKFKDKKITCYHKYNGFLGIMSMIDGELFLSSKSTNKNDFSDWFRKIYENSNIDKETLEEYLHDNAVSLTFEVIDPINDPHIIKYNEPKIVLLDIINNDDHFYKAPYDEVVKLGKMINCEYKEIYKEFNNFRDFHTWYLEVTDEDNMSHTNIEGVVIECDGIMTKLKFPYYNFWKFMRIIKEQVKYNSKVELRRLYNDTSNYFYDFCKKLSLEELEHDIIYLREKFEREYAIVPTSFPTEKITVNLANPFENKDIIKAINDTVAKELNYGIGMINGVK